MKPKEKLQEVEEQLDEISEQKMHDLSSDQDLSLALMNLISLEEHFIFSGFKTEKGEYYNLSNKVREIRKDLLEEIVQDPEGEVWCISKHLLSSSMRLMEVGTKQLDAGNERKAERIFDHSYSLYSLFWSLNKESVRKRAQAGQSEIDNANFLKKKVAARKEDKKKREKDNKETTDEDNSFFKSLKSTVSELVDCCRE